MHSDVMVYCMPTRARYASMEYAVSGYRENDLVRLDVLIAGEPALPLAAIVHKVCMC